MRIDSRKSRLDRAQVAPAPRCPRREVKRSPERPRGPRLGKLIAGRASAASASSSSPAQRCSWPAKRARGRGPRALPLSSASSSACSTTAPPRRARAAQVDAARARRQRVALEDPSARPGGHGERLLRVPLRVGEVAARPADRWRSRGARRSERRRRSASAGPRAPVDHLARPATRSASRSTRPRRARSERSALELSGRLRSMRVGENLLHLADTAGRSAEPATPRGQPGSGVGASARARPRARRAAARSG